MKTSETTQIERNEINQRNDTERNRERNDTERNRERNDTKRNRTKRHKSNETAQSKARRQLWTQQRGHRGIEQELCVSVVVIGGGDDG